MRTNYRFIKIFITLFRKQYVNTQVVKERVKNETLGSPTFLGKGRKRNQWGGQDTANIY